MNSNYENINLSKIDSSIILELNRPKQMNALSLELFKELNSALDMIEKDSSIRGMIVAGAGDRAFAAGADIKAMYAMSPDEGFDFARLAQATFNRIENLSIPVIACVDGVALGGGCELAMSTDFIYATEHSRFGQPEVSIGLIPCFGGCVRLPRYVGLSQAKKLIMTGEMLNAAQAETLGLVLETFPSNDEMIQSALALLAKISVNSSNAIALSKNAINAGIEGGSERGMITEQINFKKSFEHPHKEQGLGAFIRKEPICFD